MTVKSKVVSTYIARATDSEIPIKDGLRIQIIPTIEELVYARKHQYAAFIASESMLVVWDDNPPNLPSRAESIQSDLLKSALDSYEHGLREKGPIVAEQEVDAEAATEKPRPTMYYNTILTGFSLCLLVVLSGLGWATIAKEVLLLRRYASLAFLAMIPIDWFLAMVS